MFGAEETVSEMLFSLWLAGPTAGGLTLHFLDRTPSQVKLEVGIPQSKDTHLTLTQEPNASRGPSCTARTDMGEALAVEEPLRNVQRSHLQ